MCSIFGAVLNNQVNPQLNAETNRILQSIFKASFERGRDGRGFTVWGQNGMVQNVHDITRQVNYALCEPPHVPRAFGCSVVLGNMRAEPTTEFVNDKKNTDQQPYTLGGWSVVHNGTIANDKELREEAALATGTRYPSAIDSAAIVESLAAIEADSLPGTDDMSIFFEMVEKLKGSYAILAKSSENDAIHVACNYRPIWYIQTAFGIFFASTRDAFPRDYVPQMVKPYTVMCFWFYNGEPHVHARPLNPPAMGAKKALVVCSGGLDSVVSAWAAKHELGHDVELMHFHYGSRAEGPESVAINKVAELMQVPLHHRALPMWDKEDSNLLNADSTIAGGEAGAEFAHEWVPARNLVMLAVATAFAEAKGFNYIVLGNNLEEAGAYPDNEPEFIAKFNDLLPFAVGDGKKVTVVMPVGNMMKHEIVEYGHRIGAPMHLTWSCYRAGAQHCGKCGPCYMRRTAFKINNLDEVITYEA